MANLIYENVSPEEFHAIRDKRINYHIMKDDKANVGNLLSFNTVTELVKEPQPTNEIFKITHVMKRDNCPHIAKGFAIVTLRQMVEAKK